MAATYTLVTTTLQLGIGATDNLVTLASTSGVMPASNTILYFADGEGAEVLSFGPLTGQVFVKRGVFGPAVPHSSGVVVFVAPQDQLYDVDPVGAPLSAPLVSPWINVQAGRVWDAYGDDQPEGATYRYWQLRTNAYSVGPMGVRVTTLGAAQS